MALRTAQSSLAGARSKHSASPSGLVSKQAGVLSSAVAPSALPQDQFLTMMNKAIIQKFPSTQNLLPFNNQGAGNFPFDYFENERYNLNTFQFINRCVTVDQYGCVNGSSGLSFTEAIGDIYKYISYSLSTADQAKLDAEQVQIQIQEQTVVQVYQNTFGTITQAEKDQAKLVLFYEPTQIDYVISYFFGWICTGRTPATQLSAVQMQSCPDLRSKLTHLPPSGEPVLSAVISYLNATSSQFLVWTNAISNASARVIALQNSIQMPQTHGGVQYSANPANPGQYYPSWFLKPGQLTLQKDVMNSQKTASCTVSMTYQDQETSKMSVNGHRDIFVPVAWFFSIRKTLSASKSLYEFCDVQADISINVVYPGPCQVTMNPTSFQFSTKSTVGWFDKLTLEQALQNGDSNVTGWKYLGPKNMTFGPNGNASYLEGLLIAGHPMFELTYNTSEVQKVKQAWSVSGEVGLTFLGFPIGGSGSGSQRYKHKVTSTSSSSVTISMTPSAMSTGFGAETNVIGASYSYLNPQ